MYIILEGIVRVGKTTQAEKLTEYLQHRFPERGVISTCSPGKTGIEGAIRKVVQATEFDEPMSAVCEAYLYAAARAQNNATVIRPCLEAGGIVVSDRSLISSLVFQGVGRGLGIEKVLRINEVATRGLKPDKIIFLDLDVETALSRLRDVSGDKWEAMGNEFFETLRGGYLKVAKMIEFKNVWATVDASGTIEEVFKRVVDSLEI